EQEPWLQGDFQFGSLTVPRWGLLLPGVVFLAIFGVSVIVSRDGSKPLAATVSGETRTSGAAGATQDSPAPTRWPQLIAQAEFGDEQALDELRSIPPPERDQDVWLVLA